MKVPILTFPNPSPDPMRMDNWMAMTLAPFPVPHQHAISPGVYVKAMTPQTLTAEGRSKEDAVRRLTDAITECMKLTPGSEVVEVDV